MRKLFLYAFAGLLVAGLAFLPTQSPVGANSGTLELSANSQKECLTITNIRKGGACGRSDSIKVEARNLCDQQLRGYVYFKRANGTWNSVPVSLKPGEMHEVYECYDATGDIDHNYNVGVNPDFPPKKH